MFNRNLIYIRQNLRQDSNASPIRFKNVHVAHWACISIRSYSNSVKSLTSVPFEKIKYEQICDLANLKKGLKRTKNKAPGLDGEVKADITEKRLQELRKSLIKQTYKPQANRLVNIPKPDVGTRKLGLAAQIDKVVQATLLNLLEPIVDPTFFESSYGFRPNLSCHNALHKIRYGWQNVTWTISVDLKKCFDNLDHLLIKVGVSKFADQSTCELISKLCKAGFAKMNLTDEGIGSPQGSLISPLLCNIYLHELDEYVHTCLLTKYNKGTFRKADPAYKRTLDKVDPFDKEILTKYPEMKKALRIARHKKNISENVSRTDKFDPDFRRLYYIRYADDFLLGFVGPHDEALVIYDSLCLYIEKVLKMSVNTDKSQINHGTTSIKFLGTRIVWFRYRCSSLRDYDNDTKVVTRIPLNRPSLAAPIEDMFQRAIDNKYAVWRKDKKKGARSTSARWLTPNSPEDIVKRFNSIISGILNYYSFVNSKSSLWSICALYRKTAALTLADKLKLRTASKVFTKFGPILKIKDSVGKVIASLSAYPESLKTNLKFNKSIHSNFKELLLIEDSKRTFVKAITTNLCEFPGCTESANLEGHHLNPWKNLDRRKDLSDNAKILIRNRRKVVTLCAAHHQELHRRRILVPKKLEVTNPSYSDKTTESNVGSPNNLVESVPKDTSKLASIDAFVNKVNFIKEDVKSFSKDVNSNRKND